MNTNCQNCGKQLKLSNKILESVAKLGPGRTIRIKCPQCSDAIVLDSTILTGGKPKREKASPIPAKTQTQKKSTVVKPPAPPDITWIKEGIFDEEQSIEDVPLALVLMPDSKEKDTVIEAIEGIGYKTDVINRSEEAIEKMQFTIYSAVVLHSKFEGNGINSSQFHQYMCSLHMSKRRFIYYAIIGKEFRTLYNLQALACSANLVVNEKEVSYLSVIVRKVIPEYEELFGPVIEEMRLHGK